jgi:hypothetical protein
MRAFIKHKVFGTVYAAEIDDSGAVIAALPIGEAPACVHRLPTLELTLDHATEIRANLSDWKQTELPCTNATHLLAVIGEAERECAEAQASYDTAHSKAKAAKEILETKEHYLRKLVRDATAPVPLPLFDQAGV